MDRLNHEWTNKYEDESKLRSLIFGKYKFMSCQTLPDLLPRSARRGSDLKIEKGPQRKAKFMCYVFSIIYATCFNTTQYELTRMAGRWQPTRVFGRRLRGFEAACTAARTLPSFYSLFASNEGRTKSDNQRCYTKYAQIAKNRIFRGLEIYVKINLETQDFANCHIVVQTDGEKILC